MNWAGGGAGQSRGGATWGREPSHVTGRLLLVEDDPLLGSLLVRWFGRWGYEIKLVTSCAAADGVAEVHDCGILDIELPDGDGVDLAHRLLRDGRVRCVVFHTGAPPSVQERARPLGTVLTKPTSFFDLELEVSMAVDRATAGV
jgi:DNA-binding response OmpR family regulator